jgi:TMPIT-like protein
MGASAQPTWHGCLFLLLVFESHPPIYRYQQKRMYTRIALGKNSAMDVVGGESSGMPGQLIVLLPGLFALQAWQILLGSHMTMQTWQSVIDLEGWLVRRSVAHRV